MKNEIRTQLCKKFPENLVKQRKGAFGRMLNYLEAAAVVERLNECFQNEWTFTIVSHRLLESGEVLVHGRLEAVGIVKEDFGRGTVAVARETGEVVSMADAFKAASSDAIKRCARLLGVGAYLYSEESEPSNEVPTNREPRPVPHNSHISNRPNEHRLTQKQLSAIWSMARKAGYRSEDMRDLTSQAYRCQPEQLSKTDASALIGNLSNQINKRGAA